MNHVVVRQGQRIEVETIKTGVVAKRRRAKPKFVMLPYKETLAAAGREGNATLAVLVELARLEFETHNKEVQLTNKALKPIGIRRDAKNSALRRLEVAGVVRVRQDGSRAPLVTLLWKLYA
jgi:hypothetical protein